MAVWVKEKQAGSGIWWVFRKSRMPDGRIIRTSKRCKSKKQAERLAEKASGLEAAIKLGLPTPDPPAPAPAPGPTFNEYVKGYLTRIERDPGRPDVGLKVSTIKDYRSCLQSRLQPLLGDKRISGISSRDVKALKATLEAESNRKGRRRGQKLSRRNVEKHLRILSAVLGAAVEEELIPINPVSAIGKGRARSSRERHAEEKRRVDALSEAELATLLETAETHVILRGEKAVHPFRKHVDFLLTLADSGLRVGETLALQWGDINWRGDYVHVQRAYTCRTLDVPKSGRARKVYLTPRLKAALWQRYQGERRTRFGNVAVLDPEEHATIEAERDAIMMTAAVFSDGTGGLLDLDNLRRRFWYPLLTAAKLKCYRLHDLRHTYASRLLSRGANVKFIQQQLGHSSLKMTLDTYSHLLPGDHEGLVTLLDEPAAKSPQVTQGSPSTAAVTLTDTPEKEKAPEFRGLRKSG